MPLHPTPPSSRAPKVTSNSGPLQPTDQRPSKRVHKVTSSSSSGRKPSTSRPETIHCLVCSGKPRTDKEEHARVRDSSKVDPAASGVGIKEPPANDRRPGHYESAAVKQSMVCDMVCAVKSDSLPPSTTPSPSARGMGLL